MDRFNVFETATHERTRFSRFSLVFAGVAFCVLCEAVNGADWADGKVHTVDTRVPVIYVTDGSQPTQVFVIEGADIAFLNLGGSSHAHVAGGTISHVDLYQSATAIVTSGSISHLRAHNQSHLTVDGVQNEGGSHVTSLGNWSRDAGTEPPGNSIANILGGTYTSASAYGTGITNVYGGNFVAAGSWFAGTLNVFGGTVSQTIESYGGLEGATTNIYGGQIGAAIADWNGTINVFGGRINELRDGAGPLKRAGYVHVYGQDLRYSGIFGERLTGVLLDGTKIDAPVYLEQSQLYLHQIPEPATVVWLISAFCTVVAGRSYSRRRLQLFRVMLGRDRRSASAQSEA